MAYFISSIYCNTVDLTTLTCTTEHQNFVYNIVFVMCIHWNEKRSEEKVKQTNSTKQILIITTLTPVYGQITSAFHQATLTKSASYPQRDGK